MNAVPPPLPRPCEKCGADLPAPGEGMLCRSCGRRWHQQCGTGIKLCPRCKRPLQSAAALQALAEQRMGRKRSAWLLVVATCVGAWALALACVANIIMHFDGTIHADPWPLQLWWIASTAVAGVGSGVLWALFFKSRDIGTGIFASVPGVGFALLVIFAGMRDAPEVEERFLDLGRLSIVLFGSTIALAIRWKKMPER